MGKAIGYTMRMRRTAWMLYAYKDVENRGTQKRNVEAFRLHVYCNRPFNQKLAYRITTRTVIG